MKVLNTTIQNRAKRVRLDVERSVPRHHLHDRRLEAFIRSLDRIPAPKENVLFSMGVALLGENDNPAVSDFLAEYDLELVDIPGVPRGAFDLLGSTYQYLNTKAENLAKGSFYTGAESGNALVSGFTFGDGQTVIDPACGSGSLLFRCDAPPGAIVGIDNDPIAVMIAKFNYFLKFPDAPAPALYCDDFFEWRRRNPGIAFDYVVGNPPYGAELDLAVVESRHVTSGESFSYFIETGVDMLTPTGMLRFLVPDALLNVKRHSDVREFLLDHANIRAIEKVRDKFTGVMSDLYILEVDRNVDERCVTFITRESTSRVPKDVFRSLKDMVFVQWEDLDVHVIAKVNERRAYDLGSSVFGLGVVTGDNKSKLLAQSVPGAEPIYTGKEVAPYKLLPPSWYLVFDRENLQQVAPDDIYRAPEKLVYKTISRIPRVALDTSGSLTTNSANIIIPRIPGYSAAAVMGLLNSSLYAYLYEKLFGGVNKMGKAHLQALPFPEISPEQNMRLVELVEQAAASGIDSGLQSYVHREIFGLDDDEVAHVLSRSRVVRMRPSPGSAHSQSC